MLIRGKGKKKESPNVDKGKGKEKESPNDVTWMKYFTSLYDSDCDPSSISECSTYNSSEDDEYRRAIQESLAEENLRKRRYENESEAGPSNYNKRGKNK